MSEDNKAVPVQTEPEVSDLVVGNEYLKKEQQKFFANQWMQQQKYQINCGGIAKLKLDNKEYFARTVSKAEENEMKTKAYIFEKLSLIFNFELASNNPRTKEEIKKFKQTVADLQKEVNEADEDFITYGAEIYFGIPKDIATQHFEEISPYVLGRKYLNDLRVTGTTFSDIKNNIVPKDRNNLQRFLRDVTENRNY